MSFAIALLLIIVALPYVILLRAFLAVRIGGTVMTPITMREPPPAWADLYAADALVFQSAGFVGPFWFAVGYEPAKKHESGQPVAGMQAIAIWIHTAGTLAQQRAPADKATPHTNVITLFSEIMGDNGGIMLETPRNDFSAGVQSCAGYQVQQISTYSLEVLLNFHHSRTAAQVLLSGTREIRPFVADQASAALLLRQFEARHVQQLQAANKVKTYPDGRVYIGWRMGLQAVLAYIRREKLPAKTAPIPPARLVHFSQISKRVAATAPPPDRQWSLFLVSVVASIVAGAVILGWAFSLQLLSVILIHELGHFLAMRAFGYKNMQMLALPLVGGVAMGYEEKPNANHRAWMALAGPLPGIAIGIALYVVNAFYILPTWCVDCANIFLLVNVLNLLPFPPLDGSKVLDALMPKQHFLLSAWITLLGALIGVGVAWYAGFTILAVIIGLQLLATPVLFARAKAAAQVRRKGLPEKRLAASLRLQGVFESIDQTLGVSHEVPLRSALGAAILESDTIVPMRWPSRVLIGGLFFGTLAIPVAVALAMMMLITNFAPRPETVAQMQRDAQALDAQQANFKSESLKLSLAELQQALQQQSGDVRIPGTDADIEATQARLSASFTKELIEFYRRGNGLPRVGVAPLTQLKWQQAKVTEYNDDEDYDGAEDYDDAEKHGANAAVENTRKASTSTALRFNSAQGGQLIKLAAGVKLLALSDEEIWYDLETPPRNPGIRVYTAYGVAFKDLRPYFAERWVDEKSATAEMQLRRAALQDQAKRWLQKSDQDMLYSLQNPMPWYFFANTKETRPAVASAQQLRALAARVGALLPEAHAALLSLQNGEFLNFLSAEKITSAKAIANASAFLGPLLCLPDQRCPQVTITPELLKSCWMISGMGGKQPYAQLLWCPKLPQTPYIDAQHFFYPSARHYVAEVAAMSSPK
jgi:Zn-dependent protease